MSFKFSLKKIWFVPALFAAVVFFCAFCFGTLDVSAADGDVAAQNVYVENMNVSGMNADEINAVIQQKLAEYSASVITINVGSASVDVTAGEMGVYLTDSDIASDILQIGNIGNVWKRYEISKKLGGSDQVIFALNTAVSEEAVRNVVQQKCVPLNTQRQDMTITMGDDGSLHPSDKQDGIYVNEDETVSAICEYMNSDWCGGYGEIDAVTDIDEASGDASFYSQSNDIIGSGSTSFNESENPSRTTNINVATSRINGTVLNPGEEFSALSIMEPFNAESGYETAPSIEMGEYVKTYGGGVCQVSTTLYRAVLEAELEVTERSEHSRIVGYVDPSMDAAVAEGVKDFKFVNNTDYPIYIEGYVSGGTITFNIYGHETRDPGRTIEFIGEVIKRDEMGTSYETDSSLDMGLYEESAGSDGVEARAIKVVYQNGVEESREEINYSSYEEQDHVITVGTKGASTEQLSKIQEAVANQDLGAVSAVTGSITLHTDQDDETETEETAEE